MLREQFGLAQRSLLVDIALAARTHEWLKSARVQFMKKALKRHGKVEAITTDGLRSYKAALDDLGNREK